MCTLPSANIARTCWTMESLRITALHPISQKGAKGEEGHRPRSGLLFPLLHPGSMVSRRRSKGHLGRSRPGCTGPVRGGGSVSSVLHTYPGLVGLVGNVSSPALKGRHKSTIKASNSETMVNVFK